jgi:protoporphyrinogen oxidase
MKIGIIGAGFGGLAAAYELSKEGHEVIVLESGKKPGGLAIGFQEKNWKWSMESHYHHWFTNDSSVLNLAKEIGHEVLTIRPKTSTYIGGNVYQVDSPQTLLRFTPMPFIDRVRTGAGLAYLKVTKNWKPLEKVTAKKWILKYMGQKSWDTLWGPLFEGKFEKYASGLPASWFWTRINKRTMSLAYPKGGFQSFAEDLEKACKKNGVKFLYDQKVESIRERKAKSEKRKTAKTGIEIKTHDSTYTFDKVICTLPTPLFTKITKGLPEKYLKTLTNLKGIGAVNVVLSLKQSFLNDGTYWLNINEVDHPFLAIVEHTNFMNKKHYNNEHLVYIGNYVETSHEFFTKDEKELVDIFLPYLQKINPNFKKSWIKKAYVFKAPFAQPIIPLNYSKQIPPFETSIEGLYLCNMQQVYPYDRGTNYAVELGEKVARLISHDTH